MSEKGDGVWTRGPGVQLDEEEGGGGGGGGRREETGFVAVVNFNMHSPGEEEQAALSAGAPVWPP